MPPMIPDTMRYVSAATAGGPEVLAIATTAVPRPAPDEVLIRVRAAGVNRPDVAQRKGIYPPPPGASPILGLEVAGEVVAAGLDVAGLEPGAQVCALANGGGYAEYCAVPAAQLSCMRLETWASEAPSSVPLPEYEGMLPVKSACQRPWCLPPRTSARALLSSRRPLANFRSAEA